MELFSATKVVYCYDYCGERVNNNYWKMMERSMSFNVSQWNVSKFIGKEY